VTVNRVRLVLNLALTMCALVASPGATGGVDTRDRACPTATPAERAAARLAIEHLPLLFVENRGQADPRVVWSLEGRGLTAYFGRDGVTWALVRDGQRWAVKLDFVGANPDVMPEGSDPTETVFSYFKGPCEEWHTRVPSCTTLTYRELWPGIDLTYTAGQDRLKYAFTVKPGADPSRIRIACRGAELRVDAAGGLEIWTPLGEIRDAQPSSCQEIGGRIVDVPTAFGIAPADAGAAGSYGFDVGAFDASRPLVIDPVVAIYAGYIGGSVSDYGTGIAVDQDGFAYVTGYTAGGTFPADPGLDDTYNDGTQDAFVAKVLADGSGLSYAGYIGGNAGDFGFGIAVSANGYAYLTGVTYSTFTFPATFGPDLTAEYPTNFVAKVDPLANDLEYCGFIDGTNGYPAIAIDDEGGAYLTGAANGPDTFPNDGLLDQTYNGGTDAFVAKVAPLGGGFVFAGYIGGSGGDVGTSIAVDADHYIYVTGHTDSNQKTFPVKKGPDLTYGGNFDVWVAKLHAIDGIQYCGYIGGSSGEGAGGIAIDSAGAAYVTGTVGDPPDGVVDFPRTVGPDLTYHGGGSDAFIVKVAADGAGFAYAGFIGGAGVDYGWAVAVDDDRNAYVTGNTTSDETTFPVVSGPGLTFAGEIDHFVAKVKANGLGLLYCGYLGGDQFEFPLFGSGGIALDSDGNAYVAGASDSTQASFAVVGGPDLTQNGLYDAFVAKLDASSDVPPPPPPVTLDVTLLKGALSDSPKTAKDKVKVKGFLVFNGESPDGTLDPATDSVSVSIGGVESMFEFEIPAADVGWTSKNGKHTWKSAKGVLPKLVVVLDTVKQKFSVSVSKGVFSAPPETLIHVSLVAGNDAGGVESAWTVTKPGKLKFVP
jgi:hypothetical protein